MGYHMLIPALRRLRLGTVVSSRTAGSIDEILFQNNQPINQTQINKYENSKGSAKSIRTSYENNDIAEQKINNYILFP